MRLIDGDALAEELLYDAELCAKALDSHEITDHKELARLQFEKDCKQNCVYYISEAPTVDAVPVCVLKEILMRYFDIGDSYHFELTRVKEAFEVGTISVDDFQEWTEENVDDLVNYIKKNGSYGERKGGGE